MSSGEIVPEVMTTLLKRSNTGRMARDGSRQVKWNIGFGTVALSVSNGSRINMNPAWTLSEHGAESTVHGLPTGDKHRLLVR